MSDTQAKLAIIRDRIEAAAQYSARQNMKLTVSDGRLLFAELDRLAWRVSGLEAERDAAQSLRVEWQAETYRVEAIMRELEAENAVLKEPI